MPKTPQLKPDQIIKALKKSGFIVVRQRGSHVRLADSKEHRVTVPLHNRPIYIGTLYSILDQAGLSLEQLLGVIK